MTNFLKKHPLTITSFFVLIFLSSCAGRTLDARGREELRYNQVVDNESSEKELFEAAIKAYDNRQFNNASKNLETLLQNFPDGEFQEVARLKLIDAKFYGSNYVQVVTLVDEFLELFPATKVAPHVLMLAGISYSQTFGGVGRDPTPLLEAKRYFDRIIQEHPETDYYYSAQRSVDKINKTLISYQNYLVDFYQKQQLSEAAIVREQKKQKLQQQTPPPIKGRPSAPEGVSIDKVQ